MIKKNPEVSIITTFFEGSIEFLVENIISVEKQTFDEFEHIIINDGCDINVQDFINFSRYSSKIRYLKNILNGGQANAINYGIKKASPKSSFIAFCDQDDWWLDNKLERSINLLKEDDSLDLVFSDALVSDEKGRIKSNSYMTSRGVTLEEGVICGDLALTMLLNRNFVPGPVSMVVRKRVFDVVGLMNEQFSSIYDYDFLFRFFEEGLRAYFIKEPLVVYREHSGQYSRNIRVIKKNQLLIIISFFFRNKIFFITNPWLFFKKCTKTIFSFIFNITASDFTKKL